DAVAAVRAAAEAQRRLAALPVGDLGPLRVRIAINAGPAEQREGDYFGPALNRVARLVAAGHGGQTLLSRSTVDLAGPALPPPARADLPAPRAGARAGVPASAHAAGPIGRAAAGPGDPAGRPRARARRGPRAPAARGRRDPDADRTGWDRQDAPVAQARRGT